MKKLFISCPMRGRTPEAIKASTEKMHKIAEATVGEELEIIPTYQEGAEYKDRPIACLGESIKRMQEADYFIGLSENYEFHGCSIEDDVASAYGIRKILVNTRYVAPDCLKQDTVACACAVSDKG